jgi:hypothetical protein
MKTITDSEVIGALRNRLRAELYWENLYREALRKIARGEGDPVTIAWDALGDDEEES